MSQTSRSNPSDHGALDDLPKQPDVLFECSGDPIHATSVIAAAIDEDIPVATLNSEFQVTAGSYFVGKGLVLPIPPQKGHNLRCISMLESRSSPSC